MKLKCFIILGIGLSVFMSAVSLALQVKSRTEASLFAKYSRPLQISEMEYRKFRADFLMLTDYVQRDKGLMLPHAIDFSKDGNTAIVSLGVAPKELPTNFKERKEHFESAAMNIGFHLATAFDLNYFELNKYLEVYFVDYAGASNTLAKEKFDPLGKSEEELIRIQRDRGMVAVYKNGELTMR